MTCLLPLKLSNNSCIWYGNQHTIPGWCWRIPIKSRSRIYSNTPIVNFVKAISKDQDIMNVHKSLDIYGPSITIAVSIEGNHEHLGFVFCSDLQTPTIHEFAYGTPAKNIGRWCSEFRNATIRTINGEIINTFTQFQQQIVILRATARPGCTITIACEDFRSLYTAQGSPQMYFDHL